MIDSMDLGRFAGHGPQQEFFMPMKQADFMTETARWDDISLGGATPDQARALMRSAVANLTADTARSIYEALRAWVWKALNQRRRDPDLREWHDVIGSTSAVLSDTYPDLAARVATLSDLIYESVMVAETFDADDVLRRPYVQTVVLLLQAKPLSQEELAAAAGMSVEKIKLVVNMMLYSDLVTCSRQSGTVAFALSSAGRRAAMILIERRKAETKKLRRPQKRERLQAALGAERAASRRAGLSKRPSHQGQPRPPSPMVRHVEMTDA